MGRTLIDQYSLLHLAVGVICYFWNLSFKTTVIGSIIFEELENTQFGMRIINRLPMWPGGKTYSDSLINRIGDTLSVALGYIIACYVDRLAVQYGYKAHRS